VTSSVEQSATESPTPTLSVEFSHSGDFSTSFQIDESDTDGCTSGLESMMELLSDSYSRSRNPHVSIYLFVMTAFSESSALDDSNGSNGLSNRYLIVSSTHELSSSYRVSDLVPLISLDDGVQPHETTIVSNVRDNSRTVGIVAGLIGLILVIGIVVFLFLKGFIRCSKQSSYDPASAVAGVELPSDLSFGMTPNFLSQYQEDDTVAPLEVLVDAFAHDCGTETLGNW
jgi:hypothetical protein